MFGFLLSENARYLWLTPQVAGAVRAKGANCAVRPTSRRRPAGRAEPDADRPTRRAGQGR